MAEPPFLGRGWAFPPAFAAGGSQVAMVEGVDDVHQCLEILVSTERGERVMHDDFGCDLSAVMFAEVDHGLVNQVSQLVSDAILDYEPRVTLEGVDVSDVGALAGELLIRIDYTIPSTNSRFNMVFPFYLNEARLPGAGT